jgi:hypothetical protein
MAYGTGMQQKRELTTTMPPGPDDAAAHEFERACAEAGEYWARLRHVSELLGAE